MHNTPIHLLLADDDLDDRIFFEEALEEIPVVTQLTTAHDGVHLMQLLAARETLPHVLYLDLNMPRKNGFECLAEIKRDAKLNQIPVIIFSTSFDKEAADLLYEHGAHYCIRKPPEFENLKNMILKSLELISQLKNERPSRDEFLLKVI